MPRIAYLTNQYPSVSHTFIRREIRALEARGYQVLRLAIRPGYAVVDPEDREELARTRHVVGAPLWQVVPRIGRSLFRHPIGAARAFVLMLAMASVSDRGLERHVAYWLEAAYLVEVLEEEKVDHVHVHFGTNAAAVARLMRAFGGPGYSFTVHGPDEFDQVIGHGIRGKIDDSRFTVAISRYCATQLKRWTPLSNWGKIHVVHCSVGKGWFSDVPVDTDSKSMVYTGRLNAQKGLHFLIEAFEPVAKADPERKLVLVGDGEMREELEEDIARRGLQGQVVITGWQTEAQVKEHLLHARALVMGSFAEGLPVVLMEAMAMRRPVIATRITGIPELVRDGIDGWLVTPGDANALSSAMTAAFEAPVKQLDAMGAAGQQQVRLMHTSETEAAVLDGLFRRYAGNGRA